VNPSPPLRLVVVMPNWLGDAVMATPALRVMRDRLTGAFIGALVRPGVDQLLAGTDFFDEVHVDDRAGPMGPKRAAAKLRFRRYDAALLLTNSFSTALVARLAGVRRRIGYVRDGRSALLTERIEPPRRGDAPPFCQSNHRRRAWAPTPQCELYLALAKHLLQDDSIKPGHLELAITEQERVEADRLLTRAGLESGETNIAALNPGASVEAKRWPAERFACLAKWLSEERRMRVVIVGAPGERKLADRIVREADLPAEASLPSIGLTIGSLKATLARARLVVSNDSGPRHIAAAFGVPTVSLFGSTDPRWTTLPVQSEAIVTADPTLPAHEVADDHPQRCRIDRIESERVIEAIESRLPVKPDLRFAQVRRP